NTSPASPSSVGRWRVSAVPRLSFTDDEGLGLGVRGTAFWYRHDAKPYKTALSAQAFATSNGVHQHFVRVDAIDAVGLPIRLTAEVGYLQTLNFHVCWRDGQEVCGTTSTNPVQRPEARQAADVSRYFQHRYLQPYAHAAARWRLGAKPHQPELAASWRGNVYVPGTLNDDDADGKPDLKPYPGSVYAQQFPDGEPGLSSVLQVGALLDGRDHEPDPVRGYLLQVALRASHPLWGSAWRSTGAHIGLRWYAPLTRSGRVSLASHFFIDALHGAVPTVELGRIGGFAETFAFGGPDVGRGIRQQRYLGAGKAAGQWELRTELGEARLASEHFRFRLVGFFDAGLSAARLEDVISGDPLAAPALQFGTGIGLRVVWNRNFVMRIDVAVSPAEGYRPFLYTRPDHPF
ncbi:MAG: BamA/TamA family outer membrane protein, partial [Myxococcota bacterium]